MPVLPNSSFNHGAHSALRHCRRPHAMAMFGLILALATPIASAITTTTVLDDFNSNLGWQRNPTGSDTATTGLWQIGNPEETSFEGVTLQRPTGSSGSNALITQLASDSNVGSFDIDSGTTSILSPIFNLPAGSTTLRFDYYLSHLDNATNADFLQVTLITNAGQQQLLNTRGANFTRAGVWTAFSTDVSAFAGQPIRLRVAAADADTPSLIEAGFDHLRINVEDTNTAPTIENPGPQSSLVGAFASLELNAADSDDDPLSFTATGLPDGLEINSVTGTISGTPATAGTFNVAASVSDGTDTTSASFSWSVTSTGSQIVELQVTDDNDDGEESSSGRISTSSSDLELVDVNGRAQVVGIRFPGLNVPAGALIEDARLVFQIDETDSGETSLLFQTANVDDAAPISDEDFDLSTRAVSGPSVEWNNIAAWTTVGSSEQTPNLAPIVQAIVSRDGWVNGNALMFLVRGTGKRVAEARDGDSEGAPRLIVQYTLDPDANVPPVLTNPGDQVGFVGESVSLQLVATDPNDDVLDWSASGLPASLALDPVSGEISGTLSAAGQFQTTIEVSDGAETSSVEFSWNISSGNANTVIVQVTDGDDDAEETSGGGGVGLGSSDLELVEISSGAQVVGIRFVDVPVPAGSVIESARIEFQVDETDSGETNLQIRAQASDSAEPIITDDGTLSSRPTTDAVLNWDNVPAWTAVGAVEVTPNLATVVQEVVSRPGWQNGSAIMMLITGTGQRVAESWNGSATGAPKLVISYSSGNGNLPPVINAIPDRTDSLGETLAFPVIAIDPDSDPLTFSATGLPSGVAIDSFTGEVNGTLSALGAFTPTISVTDGNATVDTSFNWQVVTGGEQTLNIRITDGADDAEQEPDGRVTRRSSDLEFGEITDGPQLVALRFASIALPPGATITSASVALQVDESDDGVTNLTIQAQASDNSPALLAADNDLSSRPTGSASVGWNSVVAWNAVGASQSTPDIAALIQEVVNRPGWQSGNAITLLISGTGLRVAESADGDAQGAPELRLTYQP